MLGIEANQQIRQGLPNEALADRQMDAPGAQPLDIGQLGIEGLIEAQLLRVMLDQQLPGLGQLDVAARSRSSKRKSGWRSSSTAGATSS